MLKFFKPLFEVSFFTGTPSDLPKSKEYLFIVLISYCIINAIVYALAGMMFKYFMPLLFLQLIAFLLLSAFLTQLVNKPERLTQSFTAFVGTDLVLTICVAPAVYLISNFPEKSLSYQLGQASHFLTLIWSLAIIAMIVNSIVEKSWFLGFLIAPVFLLLVIWSGQLIYQTPSL
jgi:hypothetical protein